jgi:hypothetical protein
MDDAGTQHEAIEQDVNGEGERCGAKPNRSHRVLLI